MMLVNYEIPAIPLATLLTLHSLNFSTCYSYIAAKKDSILFKEDEKLQSVLWTWSFSCVEQVTAKDLLISMQLHADLNGFALSMSLMPLVRGTEHANLGHEALNVDLWRLREDVRTLLRSESEVSWNYGRQHLISLTADLIATLHLGIFNVDQAWLLRFSKLLQSRYRTF